MAAVAGGDSRSAEDHLHIQASTEPKESDRESGRIGRSSSGIKRSGSSPKRRDALDRTGILKSSASAMKPMTSEYGRTLQFRNFEPAGGEDILESMEYVLAEAAAASRAFQQPHLHIAGEIVGGTGFPDGVTCKWAIEAGLEAESGWEVSEGDMGGQTHTAYQGDTTSDAVWAHPIDVHMQAGSLRGWPRLLLEVWQLDDYGRLDLCGYGVAQLPQTPGSHTLSIATWRPVGSPAEEMSAFYLGGNLRLARTSYLYSRRAERGSLVTTGSGTVHVRVDIVARNFKTHGVELH